MNSNDPYCLESSIGFLRILYHYGSNGFLDPSTVFYDSNDPYKDPIASLKIIWHYGLESLNLHSEWDC